MLGPNVTVMYLICQNGTMKNCSQHNHEKKLHTTYICYSFVALLVIEVNKTKY